MGVQCACGRTLKNEIGLRKHRIHHCKVDPIVYSKLEYSCEVCGKKYATFAGLQQHRRLAHKNTYNRECELLAEKAEKVAIKPWTEEEKRRMALEELRLEADPEVMKVNDALAEFLGRSVDAIRGQRRTRIYQNILEEVAVEVEEGTLTIPGSAKYLYA